MPKNIKGREVAEIIPDRCIACQLCIGECPISAIDMQGGEVRIDPEACVGCGRCVDVCPASAILFEKPRKKKMTGLGQKPRPLEDYRGVAVFIETHGGAGAEVSWELVGKARELADKLGSQVFGFLLGADTEPVARDAISYGCDAVYMTDDPLLEKYLSKTYARALSRLCDQVRPEMLLLGATALGRDLASAVATQLETGLTADCTGLDVDPQERTLLMTRPTFGGNIMATILCRNHRPQMSTVRPKVMKLPEKDPGRRGDIRTVDLESGGEVVQVPSILDFIPRAVEVGGVDIARAEVLVVIGKGACDARYLPMFEELARLFGGVVACSRPVVQAGLLPHVRQVGQTGKTVAPRLYIGVAVSGAVQHLVGMQGAERIVAINISRQAPLVQIADYAIVGDYREIVPKLIEGIKSRTKSLGEQKVERAL